MNIRQASSITKLQSSRYNLEVDFNNNGQIMVIGQGYHIQLRKFSNQSKLLRRFQNHRYIITCIIFSKKIYWFVVGDEYGQLICWNQEYSYLAEKQHNNGISHLLLNNNEDELISCANEKKIKVWKVNYPTIKYQYDFDTNHTNLTFEITMNASENYIVTSNLKKIVLWKKNKQWKYQSEINNPLLQKGIYFISDSLLVWQYEQNIRQKSIIFEILEINNEQKLIQRMDFQYHLNFDFNLFTHQQFIYNSKKKFILQTFGNHLFYLKLQNTNEFKLVGSPISCINPISQGFIRQDGQFFVAWCTNNKGYIVYKIG